MRQSQRWSLNTHEDGEGDGDFRLESPPGPWLWLADRALSNIRCDTKLKMIIERVLTYSCRNDWQVDISDKVKDELNILTEMAASFQGIPSRWKESFVPGFPAVYHIFHRPSGAIHQCQRAALETLETTGISLQEGRAKGFILAGKALSNIRCDISVTSQGR